MAQPTQSDVHVDSVLSQVSTAYVQNANLYVARKVFPVVPVEHQSDKYWVYTKADWFRDEVQRRPDATESAGSGYNMSTSSYYADVWALHKDIGDQTRANADPAINLDRDATQFLTQRMLLRQEVQWAADAFATSVWATDLTPSSLWSDYTASDPIGDIETAKQTIMASTGLMPNTLVLDYRVYAKLKNHPDVVDRVKYTGGINEQLATRRILAELFELDNVYVLQAIKNSANEGETASYDFLAGKHALLLYVPPNPGVLTPAAGYTFVWRGASYGTGLDVGLRRFRMDLLAAERVEAQSAWDNVITGTDLGYFFNGAVA